MSAPHPRRRYEEFAKTASHAALLALGKSVDESGLEKPLSELVKLRASQINGCAFCIQYHLNVARQLGVAGEKLDLVAAWREAGVFSAREMAALAWTETLTDMSAEAASDATYGIAHAFQRNRGDVPDRRHRHDQSMEPDRRRTALCPAIASHIGERGMSGSRSEAPPEFREVGEAEIGACYDLMRQLRPHLATAEEFAERWRRQAIDGYRIMALWSDRGPYALAGFRITESMIHGRFLYVDDLVADAGERSHGLGARLMERLKVEGRSLGCAKLVLDTGLDNALGHRFYCRQGLLAMALRFSMPLS